MNNKKIIFSIADGFHWKYLFETGLIDHLSNRGYSVILLAGDQFKNIILKRLSQNNDLKIYYIKKWEHNKVLLFLMSLFPLLNRKYTQTENFQKEEFNRELSFKLRFVMRGLFKIKLFYNFLFAVLKLSLANSQISKILEDEMPEMVITSTPGQKIFDIPFLISAEKLHIETFCPIYSWDNLTSKGNIVFKPTYLAVWNETMVNEAVQLHNYKRPYVFKLGSPTFESYFSEAKKVKNFSFIRKLFKDEKINSYILLSTVPVRFYGSEHINLANTINRILIESNFHNVGILIRVHPMDHTNYSEFDENDRITVDYFGSKKAESRETALDKWFPTKENISHLKASIINSSICINVASTISLEASLCGKKVLNIGYFEVENNYAEYGDPKRFYAYTHYRPVIEQKLAEVILSEFQLADAIVKFLKPKFFYNEQVFLSARKFLGADGQNAALKIADKIQMLVESESKN